MKLLVSVIILSYNQSEYLLDAIESVINQTVDNWELIIIDNGSTDDSHELLQEYKENAKINIVLHSENVNITVRCNEGVSLAKGEFISFLFADDYYLPEKLEKQLLCFAGLSPEWGVVHGPGYGVNVFSGEKKLMECIKTNGYILEDLFSKFFEGFINPITPLVRRECFVRYPFYEDLFTEGEDIFFKLAMGYKFYYIDEPLVVMREHDRNMRFAAKRNAEITEATLAKLEANKEFPVDCLPALRVFRGRVMRNYAWQDMRLGSDLKWGLRMYAKAVRADWRQVFHYRTLIGVLLIVFLPARALKYLNNTINKWKQVKVSYFEDYV